MVVKHWRDTLLIKRDWKGSHVSHYNLDTGGYWELPGKLAVPITDHLYSRQLSNSMAIVSILATCLPWRICRFCASTYTTHSPPMLGSTPFGEASAPSLAQCHVGDECLSQLGQSMGLNIWSSQTWQLRRSRLTVLSCTKSCRVQCLCTVLTNGD